MAQVYHQRITRTTHGCLIFCLNCDRLSTVLADKLNENGWLDDFRHQSKGMFDPLINYGTYVLRRLQELARDDTMTVEAIMSGLRPRAEGCLFIL